MESTILSKFKVYFIFYDMIINIIMGGYAHVHKIEILSFG